MVPLTPNLCLPTNSDFKNQSIESNQVSPTGNKLIL